MSEVFIAVVKRFLEREAADRDIRAFKCLLASLGMVWWEVGSIIFGALYGITRLGAIVFVFILSAGYILVGHPVVLVMRRMPKQEEQ